MEFELFLCSFGNGTVVCNKAVIEHGDYKTVAHVSVAGNIKLYVPAEYIPEAEMQRIRRLAELESKTFRTQFELQNAYKQYEKILDSLPISKFLEVLDDKRPLDEKLPELREYYYSIV